MKTIILIFASASCVFSQGAPVNQSAGPPPAPVVKQFFKDANSNLQYVCIADQRQATTTQRISNSTLTNIVVLTNVGTVTTAAPHGLYVKAQVTTGGATVVPALNGVYAIATVPSTTTYTIATVAVADGTYVDAGLVISTTNPLLGAARWAIQVLTYDALNFLTGSFWANGTGYLLACTDRVSY